MKTRERSTLAALCTCLALAACGGKKGPPRHPVAEMMARADAKVELVELIVSDPVRAERVRQIYITMAAIGREYDLARARSLAKARSIGAKRTTTAPAAAQAEPAGPDALEHVLAPPLAEARAIFDRYAALTLEVRGLLSKEEFERLDRVR